MAKLTGGGILETLQVNWIYVLTALVGIVVLYWLLSRSSFTPKVKEGMGGGCSKCPKSQGSS
uniref:FeoB-associated Cys-rich membrane protein n=1 Tax=viral metagenome TaxID=1070528 RepID=A0A6C0AJ08_9ZZZZ